MKFDMKSVLEMTHPFSVLFVEDDPIICDEIKTFLEHFFTQIVVETNGLDALNRLQDQAFDIIISDIKMPYMDGLEMAQEVLKKNPDQAFIFTSAHINTDYLLQLMKMGITKFLPKPFKSNDLIQILYQTSKTLHEFEEIKKHYEHLEEENIKLLNQEPLPVGEEPHKKRGKLIPKPVSVDDLILQPRKPLHTEDTAVIDLDISELEEIYDELDALISMQCLQPDSAFEGQSRVTLSELFTCYSTKLSSYQTFSSVTQRIQDLARTIKMYDVPEDEDQRYYVFTLLESFLTVLKKWQNSWNNHLENDPDIHFFDDSINNDIATIIMAWENSQEQQEESGIFF